MEDGLNGTKTTQPLNMLRMEIGSIKMEFIKMKILNSGVGGGT